MSGWPAWRRTCSLPAYCRRPDCSRRNSDRGPCANGSATSWARSSLPASCMSEMSYRASGSSLRCYRSAGKPSEALFRRLPAKGILAVSHGMRTRVDQPEHRYAENRGRRARARSTLTISSPCTRRALLVERAIVAEAAPRIDDETLRASNNRWRSKRRRSRDPVHFLICDREFHLAIYRCSRQSVARGLRRSISTRSCSITAVSPCLSPARSRGVIAIMSRSSTP